MRTVLSHAVAGSAALLLGRPIAAHEREPGRSPGLLLRLPFRGRWFVMQGGDTENVNHHQRSASQRYGVDFTKVGGPAGRALTRRSVADGSALQNSDFHSWEAEVLAPAAGVVVHVASGEPDNPVGQKDSTRPFGNHVVIDVAGVHIYLAHLQAGSVAVEQGDRVHVGTPLGRCGNSGHSDFPHLHVHAQDSAEGGEGEGVNATFTGIDVELSGKQFTNVDWPMLRGLFITSR
jgi:hypothetical protein